MTCLFSLKRCEINHSVSYGTIRPKQLDVFKDSRSSPVPRKKSSSHQQASFLNIELIRWVCYFTEPMESVFQRGIHKNLVIFTSFTHSFIQLHSTNICGAFTPCQTWGGRWVESRSGLILALSVPLRDCLFRSSWQIPGTPVLSVFLVLWNTE